MLIAITVLAFVVVGYEIAVRCWGDRAGALERWCAALALGSALWVASLWIAALTGHLNRPTLLMRTAFVVAVAVVLVARSPHAQIGPPPAGRWYVLAAVPILLWIAFMLWRASVIPPLSHDALSYHLPRAVFFMRLEGFDHLGFASDVRLRTFPANYELLLADVLVLQGNDSLTEWIATFFYVAFIVACGALVSRWWRNGQGPAWGTMLLTASVPVLLLHSGADKNDTMVAFLMVSGLVFAGRWIGDRDPYALMVSTIAFAGAIGTKPQALILAVCIAPFKLWPLIIEVRRRRVPGRLIAALAATSIAAVFLLGGVPYFSNFLHERTTMTTQGLVPYDDWVNLWEAPWVLLTAPFSSSPDSLYVPWERAPWFWKKYEIYFSHLGIPFAVSAVLLPLAIVLYRRYDVERNKERVAITVAAAVAFVILLPARFVPHGLYATALPRYVLFLIPVVFGWTIAPALRRLSSRGERYAILFLFAASAWFVREAIDNAINDRFVPVEYVAYAAEHRDVRLVPFDPWRAAIIADRFAGPNDRIAFDGGFGAWLYPAFGKSLRRPVDMIRPGSGPPQLAPDTKWVVVDQSWGMIWAHPRFRDLAQAPLYLSKGVASPEETRVFRYLKNDPRFALIYYNPARNQAVFHRRSR